MHYTYWIVVVFVRVCLSLCVCVCGHMLDTYKVFSPPVASSRQLTRSEVQNILAFLEARPTSRSTPTTVQDAAIAVGQWPDDT